MQDIQSGDNKNIADIMSNYEAELLIECLTVHQIEHYGSKAWSKQDETIQRLNMQAHINAIMRSDEFIMESLVTFDKIQVLIFDLLTSEVWKQKVLPLCQKSIQNLSSFRAYITIYHEASVCNLLQVILYYRTAIESADQSLLELTDYAYRKILRLLENCRKPQKVLSYKEQLNTTPEQDFDRQIQETEFHIQMMCLSILRFVTDQVKHLHVSVVHHMLQETDILCILVPLIEEKPWLRTNAKGEREVYENQKWILVEKNDYSKVPKMEAQVWISVYNLFMEPEVRAKYQFTEFRKSNILRLKKFLNELLIDQIPVLSGMVRALEELSIMNVNVNDKHNAFIVQQMPEMRNAIMADKNWKEIAKNSVNTYFKKQDQKELQEDMKRMSNLWGQGWIDGINDGFKCEVCGKEAGKRCSKCKNVWYCSRDCQVSNWPTHKEKCQSLDKQIKKEQVLPESKVKGVEEVKELTELGENNCNIEELD